MPRHWMLVVLCSFVAVPFLASAQTGCLNAAESGKMLCTIPALFNSNALQMQNVNSQALGVAPFQNTLPESVAALNTSIARQTALVPLAAPASGITFAWNPTSLTFVPTNDSFGPVLTERADTIGKYRLYIGFGYQYFNFSSNDGVSLKALPALFTQPDTPASNINGGTTCSLNPPDSINNLGDCGFIRDVMKTTSRLDLKLHQFTTFISFGLTNRIDLSVAIPIESVRMGFSTDATIVNVSNSGVHQFADRPGCSPCLTASASTSNSAAGIGDITVRIKGTAWKGEKSGVALGADIRVPTGDALNYLGAGAAGVTPFVVWSYHARVSPHAFVGYQVNGSSIVAGDINTGIKARLPGEFMYSAGVDTWVTKRLSVAADLIGQEVFQAQRFERSGLTEPEQCDNSQSTCGGVITSPPPPTDPNLAIISGSYNATSLSVGAKFKLYGNLLLTGNALIKVNNGGLRAKVVPWIQLSYTF